MIPLPAAPPCSFLAACCVRGGRRLGSEMLRAEKSPDSLYKRQRICYTLLPMTAAAFRQLVVPPFFCGSSCLLLIPTISIFSFVYVDRFLAFVHIFFVRFSFKKIFIARIIGSRFRKVHGSAACGPHRLKDASAFRCVELPLRSIQCL